MVVALVVIGGSRGRDGVPKGKGLVMFSCIDRMQSGSYSVCSLGAAT